jgi:ribulose-5-phosphate 4-epimerase/fuculose-1-phosphate aldolase
VPYADPGFALGRATLLAIHSYTKKYDRTPKMVLMRNHGLIALGASSQEVLDITLMADKWARVLEHILAIGEPETLSQEQVWRMVTRPDEKVRKQIQ